MLVIWVFGQSFFHAYNYMIYAINVSSVKYLFSKIILSR